MKKRSLISIGIASVIVAVLLLAFMPAKVSITGEGNLSLQTDVVLAVGEPAPAYQELIPEPPGEATQVSVFPPKLQDGGNKDNWLSVSHSYKDVPVGMPIEDGDGDPIDWDTSVGDIYIDDISGNLVITAGTLSDKCSYDIEIVDYTTYGREYVWVEELQKTLCSEVRAQFRDYVYGSGADLYQLEDTSQFNDPRNFTIDSITVKVLVIGEQAGKCEAATNIRTHSKTFVGEKVTVDNVSEVWVTTTYTVNPETGLEWTWQEANDLQAGSSLKKSECSWVKVFVGFQVSSQTFYPITPTEFVPGGTLDWYDMDVSGSVPVGATGVILHCVNTTSPYNSRYIGLRKNGSTDDRHPDMCYASHFWAIIGVDENRYFEAYVESTTDIDIYVVGYTMSGVTFKTNADDMSLGSTGDWYDIDCSTEAPSAIGLIWEMVSSFGFEAGLRKNGSSDDRHPDIAHHYCFGAVIGCDASQICEGYIESTANDFFLVGYITDGATFNTNATDVSLGANTAWTDLSALPSGANMGFIEFGTTFFDQDYGLRKNGSSEDIYAIGKKHPWGIVECDASQIIEGKIESINVDFFVVGYSTAEVCSEDITNSPASKAFGTVSASTDYWSNGTPPTFPLDDGECYFTVTNNSGGAVSVTIVATNFTGGVGWTLASSPGENIVTLKAGKSGDALEVNMVTLTTSPQAFISGLADSETKKWEIKMETPTLYGDGVLKTSTVTLTATCD